MSSKTALSRVIRIAALAVATIAVIALTTGCSLGAPVELAEKDSGVDVKVSPGTEIQVVLDSNPTTGFSWTVVDAGPTRQVGGPKYNAPESDAVGAGGTETFTFTAADSGSGQLQLEYRRPWEKNIPAEKTWTANIEVQ